MSRFSEGLRRTCVVVGGVIVLLLLIAMGLTPLQWLELPAKHIAFLSAYLIAGFASPFVICRIALWIKDGFAKSPT